MEFYTWLDGACPDGPCLARVIAGGSVLEFYYGAGRSPEAMTRDGRVYSLHCDQVGSLRVVADELGNAVKEVVYDSFGNVLEDTNPGFRVPVGFAGGLFDPDTGLIRFGCRDYDPDTGRFTALDPLGYAAGDNDLYGYCLDDPVNLVDPEGLFATSGLIGDVTIGLFGDGIGHLCVDPGNTGICYGKYPDSDVPKWVRKVRGWQGLPAEVRKEDRVPDKKYVIQTTPEQDRKMQEFVDKKRKNPGEYSLLFDDCRTFVDETLDAGGVETIDYWNKTPEQYFDDTRDKFKSKIQK